jgi:hypothetical protein
MLSIQRRGGEITLNILTSAFNDQLPQELPSLWETATKYLLENQGMVMILILQNVFYSIIAWL